VQRFQEVCNPTNWNNIPVIRSTWTIVPRALRRCSKQGKVLGRSATHTLLYKNHTRFQLSHSFWCIPRYDQSGVCTPLRAELVIAWAQSRILNAGKLTFSDGWIAHTFVLLTSESYELVFILSSRLFRHNVIECAVL